MATNLTDTTFRSTYKDDFRDSDNFHRVLFNSGKAVQARELTQLQTIINKEIQRFGSNIFKDGGVVEPGGITVNNKMEFIKLAPGQLPVNPGSAVVGQTFTVKAPDPALEVKVIKLVQATGSDPDTLYVEYVSTQAGTSGSDPGSCAWEDFPGASESPQTIISNIVFRLDTCLVTLSPMDIAVLTFPL